MPSLQILDHCVGGGHLHVTCLCTCDKIEAPPMAGYPQMPSLTAPFRV